MTVRTRPAAWLAAVVLAAGCGEPTQPPIDLKKAAAEQEAAQRQADDEEKQNIKDRRQERQSKPKS